MKLKFKIDREDFRYDYSTPGYLYIELNTPDDLTEEQQDDVHNTLGVVKLYDQYFNWFRPSSEEIFDVQFVDTRPRNEMKFVKFLCGTVVIFSKDFTHADMPLVVRRIAKCVGVRSNVVVVSAGFVSGDNFYGKSESLRVDSEGNQF
ncbi:hypothetical protein ASwh1_351 [Aeromonas phage Aswh_1]|nr:hypothetical protein ASwh1_351 [Aeromonas phage Aswh_1]